MEFQGQKEMRNEATEFGQEVTKHLLVIRGEWEHKDSGWLVPN